MSTALVLHTALPLVAKPSTLPPRALTLARAPEPTYVFGDSTPFPHESNVIQTLRRLVDACVELLRAHATGLDALARVRRAERRKLEARAQLVALAESVRRALAAEGSWTGGIERTVLKVVKLTKATVESDAATIESDLVTETKRAHETLDAARAAAAEAVARFAAKHDLPGTRVDLRLVAQDEGYEVEALVSTPYGMTATFRCDVPASHAWRKVRTVRELAAGTTISLPREVGVFTKRLEVRAAKLDKLRVLGVSIEGDRGALLLGEDELTHELSVDGSRGMPRVFAREASEAAGEREPYELSSEDAVRALKLYRAAVASTRDLASERGKMTEATLDGNALRGVEPAKIAARMVHAMAPLAREIARRSGAPGELVLRKNVGAGRRDEVYVTAAELLEPIRTLPPALRTVFGPLGLDDAPRSPRAPAPSMASYEEVHDADIEPIDRETPTLTAG